MRIHGLIHIRYHIKYMYSLRRIYDLMRISYHIFHMYIISHVLAISHLLTDFRSHNTYGLPIFCVTWPHTEPMPYIPPQTEFATSTAYTTYTVFSPWKLSTGTCVTPTVSHFSWDWKSFSLFLGRSQFIWVFIYYFWQIIITHYFFWGTRWNLVVEIIWWSLQVTHRSLSEIWLSFPISILGTSLFPINFYTESKGSQHVIPFVLVLCSGGTPLLCSTHCDGSAL